MKSIWSNIKARWEKQKKEWRWKRTKRRVKAARESCHARVFNEFYEEELKRRMSAELRYAGIEQIADERLSLLGSQGLRTAYDIYRFRTHDYRYQGREALEHIFGIGPILSRRIYDWSLAYVPSEITVRPDPREYARRHRKLMRQYLEVKPPPFPPSPPVIVSDPCPKCGKSLGAGVTRCWASGCNYVVPLPMPEPSSPPLSPMRRMSICEEIRAERNISSASPETTPLDEPPDIQANAS
jgi:hypothetical protein